MLHVKCPIVPSDPILFRAVISVLVNFEDHMSLFYPLISALDSFNKRKSLPIETLNTVLENMATYLENLPRLTDEQKWNNFISSGWAELMPLFETFFRKLSQIRPLPTNLAATLRSMICILRAPTSSTIKVVPWVPYVASEISSKPREGIMLDKNVFARHRGSTMMSTSSNPFTETASSTKTKRFTLKMNSFRLAHSLPIFSST